MSARWTSFRPGMSACATDGVHGLRLCLKGGQGQSHPTEGDEEEEEESWERFSEPLQHELDAKARALRVRPPEAGQVDVQEEEGGSSSKESTDPSGAVETRKQSSSVSASDVQLYMDPLCDPGNMTVDFETGLNNASQFGPWPEPKGTLGTLFDAYREREIAQADPSYKPPGGTLDNFIDPLGAWSKSIDTRSQPVPLRPACYERNDKESPATILEGWVVYTRARTHAHTHALERRNVRVQRRRGTNLGPPYP